MEMPLFVKVDKYDEITKTLRLITDKLGEAEKSLERIRALKTQEDKEMESWNSEIEKIREKISNIEGNLTTPEQ